MTDQASTMQQNDISETVHLTLPGIGTCVKFRLRGGEFRSGVDSFPAIITRSHPDRGVVDLVVILDSDDFMSQKDVPALSEVTGWGWSPVEDSAAAVRADLDAFKSELAMVVFGAHDKADESVYDMLDVLGQRLSQLEKASAAKNPKKRG